MTTNEIVSLVMLVVFVGLTLVGSVSTALRSLRYARRHIRQPVLLPRDRDLLLGVAIPFVLVGTVRVFGWEGVVRDSNDQAHLLWLLITGLPPIYAMARYVYFELFVIEKEPRRRAERAVDKP